VMDFWSIAGTRLLHEYPIASSAESGRRFILLNPEEGPTLELGKVVHLTFELRQTSAIRAQAQDDYKLQDDYKEKDDETRACRICFEQPRIDRLPCGHLCLCKTCAPKTTMCPLCRTSFDWTLLPSAIRDRPGVSLNTWKQVLAAEQRDTSLDSYNPAFVTKK